MEDVKHKYVVEIEKYKSGKNLHENCTWVNQK